MNTTMANEEKKIKTSTGYFEVIGNILVDNKTFALNVPGKNNANWMQNVFNPKVEAANGQSMYMRFSSGYDVVKGKKIFARNTSDANLEISFGDRKNENILKIVNDKSFIRIGYGKELVKNEETGKEYKQWTYHKVLDAFDAIEMLKELMPISTKQKVRITGQVKFSTYNGEVQRNYELQSIQLLNGNEEEGKELPLKLEFTQNVLLVNGCYTNELDEKGEATVKALIMTYKSKEYSTIPVNFLMKANDDKDKATYNMVLERYFNVPEGKVRRMTMDCIFESGYSNSNVNIDDLPDEAKELLELGLYDIEEVVKMYATGNRVDNLLIKRPKMRVVNEKLHVEMNDDEYTLEDLEGRKAEVIEEEIIESDEKVDDLLSQLNDM